MREFRKKHRTQISKDMALSLFTDIPDTCYTSQLQKIEIETDAISVSLTIIHQVSNYRGLLSSSFVIANRFR